MRKYIVALAALAVASALPASRADAAGLYRLDGWVLDVRGQGLANVTITDGTQTMTSDVNGAFRVEESAAGTYTLRFSGSKIETFSESVKIETPLFPDQREFVARYRLSNTIASPYVSTRNGPRTVTASLTSQAPAPGAPGEAGRSCVKVTDTRTGTTGDATRSATNETSWSYSVEVPAMASEGTYRLEAKAVDCASGLVLSSPAAKVAWYTVDNTAPAIPPSTVFPTDGGNTAHGDSMWLAARISDPAGVTTTSIRFELRDAFGNLVLEAGGSANPVSYNATTGWAKATAGGLPEGRLYTLTVSASDRAGNKTVLRPDSLTAGGGFLVTRATPHSTTASIPSTACSVSPTVDPATGMREATCESVRATLAATTVDLAGLRHVDSGYITQFIPLDNLLVTTQVGGVKVAIPPPNRANEPTLAPRSRSMRYDVGRSTSSTVTVPVPAVDRNLGAIRVQVPATWESASVEMPATPTVAGTSTCGDSTGTTLSLPCTPDPLDARFVVTLKATADAAAARVRHVSTLDVVVRETGGKSYAAYVPPESLGALKTDPDVASVVRETLRYETAPDDWLGTADTSALAPGIRQAFGSRYGGDWIDRSVMPSVWRIGVKSATSADQQTLDALTANNDRVLVQPVPYSDADFDGFVATADAILDAHDVSPRALHREHETGRLIVRASAVDDATRAELVAALPSGVPYLQLVPMADDRFVHADRHTSGLEPHEGGLGVHWQSSDGTMSDLACTSSFTAFSVDPLGNRTTYGVSAGHCGRAGVRVGQLTPIGTVAWSGFRTAGDATVASDTLYYDGDDGLEGTGRIMTNPNSHRDIRGKFADEGLTKNLKTCFQGAISGRDGPFENCGLLKKSEERVDMNYLVWTVQIEKWWCFDALAAGGDSGGPVYEPHGATVKMMGVLSASRGDGGDGVQPIPATTPATSQDLAAGGSKRYACFTSVGQFERTTGLTLQQA